MVSILCSFAAFAMSCAKLSSRSLTANPCDFFPRKEDEQADRCEDSLKGEFAQDDSADSDSVTALGFNSVTYSSNFTPIVVSDTTRAAKNLRMHLFLLVVDSASERVLGICPVTLSVVALGFGFGAGAINTFLFKTKAHKQLDQAFGPPLILIFFLVFFRCACLR